MVKQGNAEEKTQKNRPPAYDRIVGFFRDPSVWVPTVMSVVIVLLLAATIVIALQVSCLKDRVASTEKRLAALSETTTGLQPGWISSTFVDVQPIGLGFSVVDFKAEPVDAGVRVTGSVINGTSLNHYDAAFTISLDAKREANVVIPEIVSGHSAPFEAVIGPATERSVPEKVRILFAGSTVSYY